MPHPFKVHRTAEGDVSVLHLEGFLDAHTAPVFEQAIQAELDANRPRLVVDGEKLTYISSAGLGVFMAFIGGLTVFRRRCAEVAAADYAGFQLTK